MISVAILRLLRRPSAVCAGRRRCRFGSAGLALLLLIAAPSALSAQQIQPTQTEPAPAESAKAATVQELEDLAIVIEDEAKRKEFLARIRTLIATAKETDETPAAASIGTRLATSLSQSVSQTRERLVATANAFGEIPALFSAIRDQVADPISRQRWGDLIVRLVYMVLGGIIAEWLVWHAFRRPRRILEQREADTLGVRLTLLVGRAILDLVPIAAFAAAAYAVAPLAGPIMQIDLAVFTLVNATLVTRALLVVPRLLLAPRARRPRLVPLTEVAAHRLFVWLRRLIGVAVFGFLFTEALLLLGLSEAGHSALQDLLGLILAGLVVVFLLTYRAPVADWIRGGDAAGRPTGRLRDRFADVWHVLAVIYVAAIFTVWVRGTEGGFESLAGAVLLTTVIIVAALLIMTGLDKLVDRGITLRPDMQERFPGLEQTVNRYLPLVRTLACWAVGVIAAVALLEIWGVGVLGWLSTSLGRQIAHSAFAIIAVIIGALILWEAINGAIERYLSRTDSDGNPIPHSARVRTLLPLFRKVVLVIVAVMVVLIVLSELGINIGPLLAGAGVVGLAVGFGAQTLVKDVITGLFIIVEDTIAVGDFIAVGGHEGIVESLSIRTVRLRDPAGSVHTVPFSEVTTVLNYTKDFSYAVLDVGVAYGEKVDEVMAVIEELGREMADTPDLAVDMLKPLEVLGVHSLDDSAVVIRARIQVRPGKQWGMKREFNRRMKNRFDELGIEIPFPQRTVWFAESKAEDAESGRREIQQSRRGPAKIAGDLGDTFDAPGGQ